MADQYVPGGPAAGSSPTAWADEWAAGRAELGRGRDGHLNGDDLAEITALLPDPAPGEVEFLSNEEYTARFGTELPTEPTAQEGAPE